MHRCPPVNVRGTPFTRFLAAEACLGCLLSLNACASLAAPTYVVEKPAMMIPGQPGPRYPEELLATGDTGTVRIRVVISPAGRPVMSSVKVLASPHPAFTRAALDALPQYRFTPADIGEAVECYLDSQHIRICERGPRGRKVAMPIDIPFRFTPPRRASGTAPPAV